MYDIIFAHITVMQHAKENFPNQNIIIYEDDFFWSKYISAYELDNSINEIIDYINNNNNDYYY